MIKNGVTPGYLSSLVLKEKDGIDLVHPFLEIEKLLYIYTQTQTHT